MAVKHLKSISKSPEATPQAPLLAPRADVETLRRVAAEAGRSVPPAVVRPARRTVLVNVKVSEELALALVERAEAEGITQKQIIMRALAAAGLPVDTQDLEDRSRRRRRVGT